MMRNVLFMRKIVQKCYNNLHCVESSYQVCRYLLNKRYFSQNLDPPEWQKNIELPEPELEFEYLVNDDNTQKIIENIKNRKEKDVEIDKMKEIWKRYTERDLDAEEKKVLWENFISQALCIPNTSSPHSPIGDESKARVVEIIGNERGASGKLKTGNDVGEQLGMLSHSDLTSGNRTLHFYGGLARLEQAMIQYTLSKIIPKGFTLLTVPDMINPAIIERCGFPTTGFRNQVFKLNSNHHGDVCFAGTAEMPLAGYFMNEVIPQCELPTRVCAVSRCYRAEISDKKKEKGLYRTKIFTKVEMFGLTANETGQESDDLLKEFVEIQKELFVDLGLQIKILDMPTQELGAPAHRKFDIETYLEGSEFWGEISSASNCTDYQSRRLNIKYSNDNGDKKHVHTVNGTACAVPRLVMAIFEKFGPQVGFKISIPPVLLPYMDLPEGQTSLLPMETHCTLHRQNNL